MVRLAALGEEPDRILGLEVGADDYIAKPFSTRELVLRVGSVLRRTQSPASVEVISDGDLELNAISRLARPGTYPASLVAGVRPPAPLPVPPRGGLHP